MYTEQIRQLMGELARLEARVEVIRDDLKTECMKVARKHFNTPYNEYLIVYRPSDKTRLIVQSARPYVDDIYLTGRLIKKDNTESLVTRSVFMSDVVSDRDPR
jgi:hypothetical protein